MPPETERKDLIPAIGKALEEPNSEMIEIQNMAPGPPTAIAVATPARLPVPTRLANDMANA